jgi:hypothetical protein
MEAAFIYFALGDLIELIDISENCKVISQIVIIKMNGRNRRPRPIVVHLDIKWKLENQKVMSLHVSPQITSGVSVCCYGSFPIFYLKITSYTFKYNDEQTPLVV